MLQDLQLSPERKQYCDEHTSNNTSIGLRSQAVEDNEEKGEEEQKKQHGAGEGDTPLKRLRTASLESIFTRGPITPTHFHHHPL